MAFSQGFNSRFFVGSQRWSVHARGLNAAASVAQIDVTSLEDRAAVYLNGQKDGSVSLDMMLDVAASSQFALSNTWETTPQPLTLGFNGVAITGVTWMVLGNRSSATVGATLADVATLSIEVQPDGPLDWGVVIAVEAAITVSGNGTAVDNTSATTNGGVAHLHSTAYSGLTSNSVIVEHSADNITYATLGTFALTTAVGSDRLVIASGTTVNRYVRVRDVATGVGSHTRFASFARR